MGDAPLKYVEAQAKMQNAKEEATKRAYLFLIEEMKNSKKKHSIKEHENLPAIFWSQMVCTII